MKLKIMPICRRFLQNLKLCLAASSNSQYGDEFYTRLFSRELYAHGKTAAFILIDEDVLQENVPMVMGHVLLKKEKVVTDDQMNIWNFAVRPELSDDISIQKRLLNTALVFMNRLFQITSFIMRVRETSVPRMQPFLDEMNFSQHSVAEEYYQNKEGAVVFELKITQAPESPEYNAFEFASVWITETLYTHFREIESNVAISQDIAARFATPAALLPQYFYITLLFGMAPITYRGSTATPSTIMPLDWYLLLAELLAKPTFLDEQHPLEFTIKNALVVYGAPDDFKYLLVADNQFPRIWLRVDDKYFLPFGLMKNSQTRGSQVVEKYPFLTPTQFKLIGEGMINVALADWGFPSAQYHIIDSPQSLETLLYEYLAQKIKSHTFVREDH